MFVIYFDNSTNSDDVVIELYRYRFVKKYIQKGATLARNVYGRLRGEVSLFAVTNSRFGAVYSTHVRRLVFVSLRVTNVKKKNDKKKTNKRNLLSRFTFRVKHRPS